MSIFGIGTNTEGTNAGELRGIQSEIACECWFTKSGSTKPLKFKFLDEEGIIQTVEDIQINYIENKNYVGVSSLEHDCTIIFREKNYHVKLIFFKEECCWVMKMA